MIKISDILLLRPLKLSDAESIAKYANNRNIWINLTDMFPYPYSVDDAVTFIKLHENLHPPKVFTIIFKKEPIGTIGISVSNENMKLCGDIGYWIGEDFWNQGIATSVIKSVIECGFKNYPKIDCISASVFIENIASVKALEKAGLTKVKMIKNAILKAGEKKDIYFYKITRENFNEQRPI